MQPGDDPVPDLTTPPTPGGMHAAEAAARLQAAGGELGHDEAAAALGAVDWNRPVSDEEIVSLRTALVGLEGRSGLGPAHQAASAGLLRTAGWELRHDRGHRGDLVAFALSPDRRHLAVGSSLGSSPEHGGALQVWELASGRCVGMRSGIPGGISNPGDAGQRGRLRWHPDGTRVGAVFGTNRVGVFDPGADGHLPTAAVDATPDWNSGPAWCWSPDGQWLAVGAYSGTEVPLRLFDVQVTPDGQDRAGHTPRTLGAAQAEDGSGGAGDPGRYPADVLDWSADGSVVTGFGHTAQIIDMVTGALRSPGLPRSLAHEEHGASFSPDGRRLAVLPEGNIAVADVTDGQLAPVFHQAVPNGATPFGTAWSPAGDQLAVLTDQGVTVLAVPSGEILHELPTVPLRRRDLGDASPVVFGRKGTRVAVLGEDRQVVLWQFEPRLRQHAVLRAHPDVQGVLLGDADRTLVGVGRQVVQFWDAAYGRDRNLYVQRPPAGFSFHDDAGHPLAYPGGNAAELFAQDPAFAVPGERGWVWSAALPGGLVVCPPEARGALWHSLSFVRGRRVAWPAHWALGTPLLEVHEQWADGLASPRLPVELPDRLRAWLVAERPPVERARGFRRVTAATLSSLPAGGRMPADLPETVEIPTRPPGFYAPDRVWSGTEITGELLHALAGWVVLVDVHGNSRICTMLGVGQEEGRPLVHLVETAADGSPAGLRALGVEVISWVASVGYLGHPDDLVAAGRP